MYKDKRDLSFRETYKTLTKDDSPMLRTLSLLSQGRRVSEEDEVRAIAYLKAIQEAIKDYEPYGRKRVKALSNKYPYASWGYTVLTDDAPPHDAMAFEYAILAHYLQTSIAKRLLGTS